MMKIIFLILSLFVLSCSEIQETQYKTTYYDEDKKETVNITRTRYSDGSIMPYPIGGSIGIAQNITFPKEAYKEKIEGRVLAVCYIDENGNVQKVEISKGLGYGCDKETIKVLYNTKFLPGIKDGKPVKVQITIPVKFNFAEKKEEGLN